MKSLNQYIFESRETIGQLPFSFELFDKFIKDAIIDAEYDNSEYWDPMEEIVKRYNPNLWNSFYSWCESIMELKISTKEFYEKIKQIPISRINRVLGAGSDGVVLDMDDKVLKIYYSKTIKRPDYDFYSWCKDNKSKVFPKIYKMGKNWVLMEKLKIKTKDTKALLDTIDDSTPINGKTLWDWIKLDEEEVDLTIFNDKQLEAFNWAQNCKKDMKKMNHRGIGWPGDLQINNIGQRKTGEIIFFDI